MPANDDDELARILSQLTDRVQRGEQVDLEAECKNFPPFAMDLRELWGAVLVAQAIGSHAQFDIPLTLPTGRDSPSGSFELPSRFGDYELLQELGRGGMGVVFRARQISLNREVALKMILRGQLASSTDRDRFRAEAESAARLEHPGIVPVYEVGEWDGRPYFTMKFIRGATLAQRLAEGPLPQREAATILAAVSRAVDYAHRCGVLHRDLKPSNILLDERGDPHVSDFGLAKQMEDGESLTKTGAVLGTPAYMAPEQAAGARGRVGPASDVYSLGVILYSMLTGHPPFQAASPVDVLLMVLEADPVPPRMLNPRADRDLEMISLRCLQKPIDLRYASAAALADDLEAYLKDESISARSGRFAQIIVWWLRETHHATVLENWGLLWMWHSVVLLGVCVATNALQWSGVTNRWTYFVLWTAGLGAWAAVFWALRRRMGPVTFVERQIAHVWAASMISIALLFPLEVMLGLKVLELSPVLGLISGMVFLVKAGMLSGEFYLAAGVMFLTAFLMARFPAVGHTIFGTLAGACFFFSGLKYYQKRLKAIVEAIRKQTGV